MFFSYLSQQPFFSASSLVSKNGNYHSHLGAFQMNHVKELDLSMSSQFYLGGLAGFHPIF